MFFGFKMNKSMFISNIFAFLAMCLVASCSSCGGDDAGLAPILSDGLPADCNGITDIFAVENIEGRTEHPCYDWLDSVYGRSAKGGLGGSAAVWSVDTEKKVALVTSACHVIKGFNEDSPGNANPDIFYNPAEALGFSFIGLTDSAEFKASEAFSASFIFYHPEIPAEVVAAAYSNIFPVDDFFILLIDSQLLDTNNGSIPIAEPIKSEKPLFYDPLNMAGTQPTYASISAGEMLLLVGYPTSEAGKLFASVAYVLDDDEAEDAIAELKAANDEEGFIPYNKDAEAVTWGHAGTGMSGGGAFNRQGQLVGIMVRMSLADVKTPIVRIVRMDHVVSKMHETIENMSVSELALISPYLDRSLLTE